MKKKHFKLLTTMASLLLVVSVMAVGIWAATQQSFKLTSSISFAATGIDAEVFAKIEGDAEGAKIGDVNLSDTYASVYSFEAKDPTRTEGDSTKDFAFNFIDRDDDGYLVTATKMNDSDTESGQAKEAVKLTLLFVNTSAATELVYNIEAAINAELNGKVTILSVASKEGTITGADKSAAVAAENITAEDVAISGGKYVMATADTENAGLDKVAPGDGTTTYSVLKVEIILTVAETVTALTDESGFGLDAGFANSYDKLHPSQEVGE